MVVYPLYLQDSGGFPPQVVPLTDGEATSETNRLELVLPPPLHEGGDDGIRLLVGGGVHIVAT